MQIGRVLEGAADLFHSHEKETRPAAANWEFVVSHPNGKKRR
jgi:hypothetical protein